MFNKKPTRRPWHRPKPKPYKKGLVGLGVGSAIAAIALKRRNK